MPAEAEAVGDGPADAHFAGVVRNVIEVAGGVRRVRPCSSSSTTKTPAPSLRTKPSRSLSNGRLAAGGLSFLVERARAEQKPPSPIGVMAASLPPVSITSA